MKKGLIGSLMVQRGMLSAAQLEQAQATQRRSGGQLDEILIGTEMLTESALQRCLAEISASIYYDLKALRELVIEGSLLEAVSYRTAMTHLLLPLRVTPSLTTLVVAAQAPLTRDVKEGLLRNLCVDEIEVCLCTRDDLLEAIRFHYGASFAARATEKSQALPLLPPSESSDDIDALSLQREGFCPSCGTPFKEARVPCKLCGRELDAAAIDPFVDRVLGSRWKLTRLLNHGGMGLIYQALDLQAGKSVAVKLLRNQFRSSSVEIQRFNTEAKILQQLEHPQIVETHEFGYQEKLGFYLVMELLEGEDLYEYQFCLALPTSLLCEIFVQVCDAMAHAHRQGIIHRDLKPENIFLLGGAEQFEGVKIFDFGIAKLLEGHQHLTQPGVVMGTPEYIAPEQAKNGPVDHRTDIYALSVILYEFLCGERLFEAENAYAYLMKHVYAPVVPLSVRCRRAIPVALEQLVMRGLAKEPMARIPSMEAYRNALLDIIEEIEHFDELAAMPTERAHPIARPSYSPPSLAAAEGASGDGYATPAQLAEPSCEQERVPTRAIYGQASGSQQIVASSPSSSQAVPTVISRRASQLVADGAAGLMQMVSSVPLPAHASGFQGLASPFSAEPPSKSLSAAWYTHDSQFPEFMVGADPAAAPTIPEALPGLLCGHETMSLEAIQPAKTLSARWWVPMSIGITVLSCALIWTLVAG